MISLNIKYENLLLIAKFINVKSYIAIFELILKIHEIEGSMPQNIISYRTF